MPIGTLTRKTQRQPSMPRIVVLPGEEPADQRAEHARRTEHGHEVAGVASTLARRHDVADDRQDQREEAAGAEALEGPERRQLVHRGRERAQRRADDEDGDREHEELLATVVVAELAVDRRRDRGRDQVRRRHPRLDRQPVEVVGDRADRGADDRLVESTQEHAQHQPGQDRQDLAVGVLACGGVRRRRCDRARVLAHRRAAYCAMVRSRCPCRTLAAR